MRWTLGESLALRHLRIEHVGLQMRHTMTAHAARADAHAWRYHRATLGRRTRSHSRMHLRRNRSWWLAHAWICCRHGSHVMGHGHSTCVWLICGHGLEKAGLNSTLHLAGNLRFGRQDYLFLCLCHA